MAFIQERDRELLRQEFQALVQSVKLVLFVEELDCQYCRETRQLLEEIAALSEKITLETYNLQIDTDKAAQFQVDKTPAIAIVNSRDYGIRYFGIPSGYEFGSLIEDILDVSKGDAGLQAATKDALTKLTQPLHFQVFVTPT